MTVSGDSEIVQQFKKGQTVSWLCQQLKIDEESLLGMKKELIPQEMPQTISDPVAASIIRSLLMVANGLHEYLMQLQIHMRSAAAIVPDTVQALYEPQDYPMAWSLLRAGVGSAALVNRELRAIWSVFLVAKLAFFDTKLNSKRASPKDRQDWIKWSLEHTDITIDALYGKYNDALKSANAQELVKLIVAYEMSRFRVDPNEFFNAFRTKLVQALMNDNAKYHITACCSSSCKGGVTFDGGKTFYIENFSSSVRNYLTVYAHIDWKALYLGQDGWNLKKVNLDCH